MFHATKLCFAEVAEDFWYGAPLAPFNPLVKILECPAKLFAENTAHTTLTGTHKADQHDRPYFAQASVPRGLAGRRATAYCRHLKTPFAPARFAVRFSYCFFRSVF